MLYQGRVVQKQSNSVLSTIMLYNTWFHRTDKDEFYSF